MWNILHFQVIFLHTEIASTLWFVFSSVFVSFLWQGREICCLFMRPFSKNFEIYLHPTILIYVHPTILINQHIWNMLHPQVQFSMTVWQGKEICCLFMFPWKKKGSFSVEKFLFHSNMHLFFIFLILDEF